MREEGRIIGEAVRDDRTVDISPTVLIGLGGSGKEVLLRMRQRFVERYGVARFPATEFLWLDTDTRSTSLLEGKSNDFIRKEAKFDAAEWHDCTVGPNDFLEYFEHAPQYGHIFSWLHPSLRKSGAVLDGARQIRSLGRLAFFHHFQSIREKITKAALRVSDARRRDEMRTRFGIEVAPQSVQWVVVFSVAGGTGSGMFLDLAFLIRHLARIQEIPASNTLGYLILPSVFAGHVKGNERLYANGYAALKELEYYSARKDLRLDPAWDEEGVARRAREVSAHDFTVAWDGRAPENIVGPPFNTCFLVGNGPAGGNPVPSERRGDVFDMIAENIFVDFASQEFASRKRSVRSNLEDYLKNDLEYSYKDGTRDVLQEVFSCRFSTFGLSKLYVPTDRIRRACGFKLAVDLVDGWVRAFPARGDLLAYVREHELGEMKLRLGGGHDDLRRQLDQVDDSGHAFAEAIRADWGSERREELHERVGARQPQLRAELQRQMDEYRKQNFNRPDDRARWAPFIRRIRIVMAERVGEALRERLVERLHAWLNHPGTRTPLAVEYLKTINQILGETAEKYRTAAESWSRHAEEIRGEWDELLGVIDDEERGMWYHQWSLRVLTDVACDVAARHFEIAASAQVFEVAAEICRGLQAFVGSERVEVDRQGEERLVHSGLVQQLFRLQEQLREIRRELQSRLESYDQHEEHLVFSNLYTPGQFASYYQLPRDESSREPVTERALADQELQLRDELGLESAYSVLRQIEERGVVTVRNALEDFAYRRFATLDLRAADAVFLLQELEESRGERVVQEVVDRMITRGNVWLRPNPRASGVGSPLAANYAHAVLLGMNLKRADHSQYAKIRQRCEQTARTLPLRKSELGAPFDSNPDTIFFYNEIAGLPLGFIDALDQYREAYRSLMHDVLHIDRHHEGFTDVALKRPDEVQLAVRINRAVLLGIMLKVLTVSGGGSDYLDGVILYVDKRIFPWNQRGIGTRREALDVLAADEALRESLEKEVDETILRLDLERREQFATLLAYHVLDGRAQGSRPGPFAPRDLRVGDRIARSVPIEYGAIQEALQQVGRRIADTRRLDATRVPELLQEVFARWHPERGRFAEEVRVGSDTLLAFRAPPTAPQPRPTGAAATGEAGVQP